ncbi:MAG TPA: hypothetical protein VGF67_27750 [Ktedonobacteraceae bacterium]|jgi:hypothetical protein
MKRLQVPLRILHLLIALLVTGGIIFVAAARSGVESGDGRVDLG